MAAGYLKKNTGTVRHLKIKIMGALWIRIFIENANRIRIIFWVEKKTRKKAFVGQYR